MKIAQLGTWILLLGAGIVGSIVLFGLFVSLLAGIIGAGFILLFLGGIISIIERVLEKIKGG